MKFKAKFSPKQFFSFKNTKYQAQNGIFITEDKKLIDFLKTNSNWICETKESNDELKDQEVKAEAKAKKKAEAEKNKN